MDDSNKTSQDTNCKPLHVMNGQDGKLQHHSKLFDGGYSFLEQHLNNFTKRFTEINRVITKLMLFSTIAELTKNMKVIKNIHCKQEILFNDLSIHLELLNEGLKKQNIGCHASDQTNANSDISLDNLTGAQLDKHYDVLNCSCSVYGVSPSTDKLICDTRDCSVSLGPVSVKKSYDSFLSTPQLEVIGLNKNAASTRHILHSKVMQKLIESNDLMTQELELLSTAEVVLDQLLLLRCQGEANEHDASSNRSSITENANDILTSGACVWSKDSGIIEATQLDHHQWPSTQIQKMTSNEVARKLSMANSLTNCQLKQISQTKVVLGHLLKWQQREENRPAASTYQSSCPENYKNNLSVATCMLAMEANSCVSESIKLEDHSWSNRQKKKHDGKKIKKEKFSCEETCSLYLKHKKRFCRMLVAKGKKFCGQHLTADTSPDENGHVRVLCPLDPNHSVYAHMMAQHLTVCNARAPAHLPYYYKDINACDLVSECDNTSSDQLQHGWPANAITVPFSLDGRILADLADDELLQLIHHVKSVEKSHTLQVQQAVLSHPAVVAELGSNPLCGPSFRKHLLQNSSLVAHLQNLGALGFSENSSTDERISLSNIGNKSKQDEDNLQLCFLEFGAGRGQLSHWVATASDSSQKLQVVLIDRGAQRYKFDTKMSQVKHVSSKRLRIDIGDLWLEKVPGLHLQGCVYAGGKHLCGAATDLTLRCLDRSVFHVNGKSGAQHIKCSTPNDGCNLRSSPPHSDLLQKKKPVRDERSSIYCSSSSREIFEIERPHEEECTFNAQDTSCHESSSLHDSSFTEVWEKSSYHCSALRCDGADGGAPSSDQKARSCEDSSGAARCKSSRGLVIALCCHHKCSWQHYVGKQFFKSIGLKEGDFPAVMGLTSWAVCAARPPAGAVGDGGSGTSFEAASSGGLGGLPAASESDAGEIQKDIERIYQSEASKVSSRLIGSSVSAPSERSTRHADDPEYSGSSVTEASESSNDQCAERGKSSYKRKNSSENANFSNFSPLKVNARDDCVSQESLEHFDHAADDSKEHEAVTEGVVARNRYVRLGLSISEREEIGRAAKHIIDHGRVQFLTSRGLSATLVQYVDRDVTLENVALVAHSSI